MSEQGASPNERLLAAAKQDNEEMLLEVFEKEGTYDINAVDGLGNTALHYAVQYASIDCLEHILEQDLCDVDIQNRLDKATPLHLAVGVEDEEMRHYVVASLLDAGADPKVRNKFGNTPLDMVRGDDDRTREIFKKAAATATMIAAGDIVDEDDLEEGDEDEEEEDD
ncbi:ankyrin [Dacryopinax primogenitus]|uniref:Ankyrin n=1 Tax=Dacryopinax primogenitus (strain DJM 731) TaxID=1858805 RepID=M5GDQ2_DACPD|nr:ankyrin [Dacryopinax primogenitus]EJU02613.1 ankyrin [Dacryopinax primogenitus]